MITKIRSHVPPNEKILLAFGISQQRMITTISLATVLLGGIFVYFKWVDMPRPLTTMPLIALAIVATYEVLAHRVTHYFVTDKKIYKLYGLGFQKIISAKREDITDLTVNQPFLERWLFKTGTIMFNTPGGTNYEVICPWVDRPFLRQRQINRLWRQ